MKLKYILSMALLGLSIGSFSLEALALSETLNQQGNVKVNGSSVTNPLDPENPEEKVDPGGGPSSDGPLRIDYVSSLNFGQVLITKNNRIYQAMAQQFYGETGPRGSYIQITDQRAVSTGWSLQVKQNNQFVTEQLQDQKKKELQGAVLSLDKGWANSSGTSDAPTVTRETIALDSIGHAYELARATSESGRGVWTIAFGASETNTSNQSATLTPIFDKQGNPVVDNKYGKPMYRNSAITLSVPEATRIYPERYTTEITWILAEVP